MVQARDGYLWFGTYDGMARFDGLDFTVFSPRNTPEMPSGGIANAHVDREGCLWVSTYKGLVSLHHGVWLRHGPEDGWTTDMARTFAEGPDGTLYVTGFDGKVLRQVKGRFEEMPKVPEEDYGGLGFCDKAGRYWVAKEAFVGFWDGSGWRPVSVSWGPLKTPEGLGAGLARDGRLWLVREGQLLKVGAEGVVRRIRLDVDVESFWQLHEDLEGDLWICSRWNGLYHVRMPPETPSPLLAVGRVVQVRRAGGEVFAAATFCTRDDEGNVWLGTAAEGLARWRRKSVEMVGVESGLAHENIRSVASELSGRLWVGTFGGGLFRSDEGKDEALRFERVPVPRLWEVESVLVDRPGSVWVTGFGMGLPVYRMDGGKARLVHRGEEVSAAMGPMLEGMDGKLWVGGETELLSHEGGAWEQHELRGVRLMTREPGTGRIWVANSRGLFWREDGEFKELKNASGGSLTNLTSLAPAVDMGLWVGLPDAGLALLRPDGVVVDLGTSVGTLMQTVAVIHDDGHGGLWLAGERGLVRVAVPDLLAVIEGRERRVKARLLDSDSGLAWNAHALFARQPFAARTLDGRLWFPTSKGLAVVDPMALGINPRTPRLLPGTVRYLDASGQVREVPWAEAGTVRIPPGARAVRVGFAALHYAAPGRVTCVARLERDGRVIAERFGPERHADYELLPPGEYALRVSASNEDGVWTPGGLGLRLAVEPHAWQTGWFQVSVLLGIFGGVVAMAAYRVRHVRLASRLAMAMERVRNVEALRASEARRQRAEAEAEWRRQREAVVRDIHDGVGGLVSNLRSTLGVVVATHEPERRTRLLNTMNSLLGETVVELRGLMDAMDARVADLGSVADELRRYGCLVLAPHGIEFEVVVAEDEGWPEGASSLFVAIFRIFKEAMANVVKHSRATRLEVVLGTSASGLRMVIHDNGVGMGPERGNGRGHGSMRMRVAELGGSLDIQQANGLRITVAVPWPPSGGASPGMDHEPHSNA